MAVNRRSFLAGGALLAAAGATGQAGAAADKAATPGCNSTFSIFHSTFAYRLVRAQELVAPTNRHPYTVAYAYDHKGRMVSKRITENDGHDTLVKSVSYLWDGWNIIQETTIDNCQTVQPSNYHALIREYDDLRLDYDDHFEGHDKLLNDINASIVTREAAWRQVEQYKARMERPCGQ